MTDHAFTTPAGHQWWNEKLARLCGWSQWPSGASEGWDWRPPEGEPNRHCAHSLPDFLSGLRPDGTCDEALVDGALLWRLECALRARAGRLGRVWNRAVPEDMVEFHDLQDASIYQGHAHPVAALASCAGAAGLFEENGP